MGTVGRECTHVGVHLPLQVGAVGTVGFSPPAPLGHRPTCPTCPTWSPHLPHLPHLVTPLKSTRSPAPHSLCGPTHRSHTRTVGVRSVGRCISTRLPWHPQIHLRQRAPRSRRRAAGDLISRRSPNTSVSVPLFDKTTVWQSLTTRRCVFGFPGKGGRTVLVEEGRGESTRRFQSLDCNS